MISPGSRIGPYEVNTLIGQGARVLEQASGKPIRVTSTPSVETNTRLSPDGRWLAYQSNEPGAGRPDEIYLHSIADKRPEAAGVHSRRIRSTLAT